MHSSLLVNGEVRVMLVHQSVLKLWVVHIILPVEVEVMVGEEWTVRLATPKVSPLEGRW